MFELSIQDIGFIPGIDLLGNTVYHYIAYFVLLLGFIYLLVNYQARTLVKTRRLLHEKEKAFEEIARQSQELESEGELEDRIQEFERRFKGQEIPLPPYWGGIRVVAERIEFWQGRPYRLHDRLLFERTEDGWRHRRLYP